LFVVVVGELSLNAGFDPRLAMLLYQAFARTNSGSFASRDRL
jgi:hypothetical protein